MKNFLIAAATLATAVSAATPAAAQWYPQQSQQQYGYGYNNYGNGSRLEQRVQMVRREIRQLDRTNRLSGREARRLDREAQFLEQRIHRFAANPQFELGDLALDIIALVRVHAAISEALNTLLEELRLAV